MTKDTAKIEDLVDMLKSGEIAAGSTKGIEAIARIAATSPSELVTSLHLLPDASLERGMRSAGMSEDEIRDMLHQAGERDKPRDPFEEDTDLTPRPELETDNPFEYDHMQDLASGPRRR